MARGNHTLSGCCDNRSNSVLSVCQPLAVPRSSLRWDEDALFAGQRRQKLAGHVERAVDSLAVTPTDDETPIFSQGEYSRLEQRASVRPEFGALRSRPKYISGEDDVERSVESRFLYRSRHEAGIESDANTKCNEQADQKATHRPNENKMSCHERERAWQRVKAK